MINELKSHDRGIIKKILELKEKRNAIILSHNYQIGEIQDIADFVGDSLGLALEGKKTDASVIIFCGVHFMAETVKIINPEKIVLMPDLNAGCSLAEMVSPNDILKWRKEHPEGIVVCYINSTAAVKAVSDICCTSTNALKIINSIPIDKEILFVPDMYLGYYLKTKTNRKIFLWNGYCHAHIKIRPENIFKLKQKYKNAEFLVHPECGCTTQCMNIADQILSTEGIVRYTQNSKNKKFIIATEVGILYKLKKILPQKKFIPATEHAYCEFMKKNTLEKVLWSLEDLKYEINVDEDIAQKAKESVEKMFSLS